MSPRIFILAIEMEIKSYGGNELEELYQLWRDVARERPNAIERDIQDHEVMFYIGRKLVLFVIHLELCFLLFNEDGLNNCYH